MFWLSVFCWGSPHLCSDDFRHFAWLMTFFRSWASSVQALLCVFFTLSYSTLWMDRSFWARQSLMKSWWPPEVPSKHLLWRKPPFEGFNFWLFMFMAFWYFAFLDVNTSVDWFLSVNKKIATYHLLLFWMVFGLTLRTLNFFYFCQFDIKKKAMNCM